MLRSVFSAVVLSSTLLLSQAQAMSAPPPTGYTETQYRQLAAVSRCLMHHYPDITPERIVGHSDIAPGRKTDPGSGFDWALYRAMLRD